MFLPTLLVTVSNHFDPKQYESMVAKLRFHTFFSHLFCFVVRVSRGGAQRVFVPKRDLRKGLSAVATNSDLLLLVYHLLMPVMVRIQ